MWYLEQVSRYVPVAHAKAPNIQSNVQVLVDLSALSVFLQQPPENPHPSEPHDLGRHTGLSGTPPLTETRVSTESLGGGVVPSSCSRVDDSWLDDADRISFGAIYAAFPAHVWENSTYM